MIVKLLWMLAFAICLMVWLFSNTLDYIPLLISMCFINTLIILLKLSERDNYD